jgi:hypothetical protein
MRTVLSLVLLSVFCIGNTASAEQVMKIKEGMTIIGSSELPKGLSIVPWKVQSPDVAVEQLHFTVADEIFQPLDRDVFRRQLGYYKQLFPATDKPQ